MKSFDLPIVAVIAVSAVVTTVVLSFSRADPSILDSSFIAATVQDEWNKILNEKNLLLESLEIRLSDLEKQTPKDDLEFIFNELESLVESAQQNDFIDESCVLEAAVLQASIDSIAGRMEEHAINSRHKKSGPVDALGEKDAMHIMNEELSKFAADRIGRPDYALSSAGSKIERRFGLTSRNLQQRVGLGERLLGGLSNFFSIVNALVNERPASVYRYLPRPAEVVIDPDVTIGNCWACANSQCNITIELPAHLSVSAVSVDHISPLVAMDISSAPKDFNVFGIRRLEETDHDLLGQFSYASNPLHQIQTFEIEKLNSFNWVKFQVLSNHGNPNFTCIYRLRVHGTPIVLH